MWTGPRKKGYDWTLGTWNVRTFNEPERENLSAHELQKDAVCVATIQEMRRSKFGEREFRVVNPVGTESLHAVTNGNCQRLVKFAVA